MNAPRELKDAADFGGYMLDPFNNPKPWFDRLSFVATVDRWTWKDAACQILLALFVTFTFAYGIMVAVDVAWIEVPLAISITIATMLFGNRMYKRGYRDCGRELGEHWITKTQQREREKSWAAAYWGKSNWNTQDHA